MCSFMPSIVLYDQNCRSGCVPLQHRSTRHFEPLRRSGTHSVTIDSGSPLSTCNASAGMNRTSSGGRLLFALCKASW